MAAAHPNSAEDLGAHAEELEQVERQYAARRVLLSENPDVLEGLFTRAKRLIVEPIFEGGTAQYACNPIGLIPGVSILIEWPRDPDGIAAIKVGQTIRVKFFYDLNLVLIQTEVIALQFQPKPYIHLAWPREVSAVEVRDVRRIKVNTSATLSMIDAEGRTGASVEGRLLDISLSGAGFFTQRDFLDVGMRGKLLISVNPGQEQTPVTCRPFAMVCARHEARRMSPPGYIYGLEFSNLTSPERLLIWSMIGQAAELRRDNEN